VTALERRLTVGAVVLPFLAFLAACALLWGGVVTVRDLAILAVAYLLTGFGVTVGFHRLLTHRAFDAPPAVRVALAVLGSMSVQGNVINWVADHRKHHTFTDEEGDPHSPHTHGGEGWRGIARGIWHSHLGWLVHDREPAPADRYARDLQADPGIVLVDRLFFTWVAIGLLLPALAGFALSGGEPLAALTGFLWGGLVRVFLLHHATWSVNSVCHIYGGRPFQIEDESRNNWAVAVVALGEGWHHNHHAFPTSARHGLTPVQWDPSWWVIRFLERVGLARNVRRPNAAEIARKQPAAGASLGV
jgi:stearoyl-CoA desaturase (delta-9 desaturase)